MCLQIVFPLRKTKLRSELLYGLRKLMKAGKIALFYCICFMFEEHISLNIFIQYLNKLRFGLFLVFWSLVLSNLSYSSLNLSWRKKYMIWPQMWLQTARIICLPKRWHHLPHIYSKSHVKLCSTHVMYNRHFVEIKSLKMHPLQPRYITTPTTN